uniref:Protein kinase domain containing protein n=1 Tax=Oryza coarctata TaxID=77588 RepID=A0A8K1DFP8_ORYCO|nr:protein kinase domain containing protein [Oryza coarctata]
MSSSNDDERRSPHRDSGDEPATAAAAADDDEDEEDDAEAQPCDPYFVSTRELAVQHGWSVAPDEIELQEMIGQGSTAEVYRATWRGLDVAVKWLRAEFFLDNPNRGEVFFEQENDALSRQRHLHVLRLMAACLRPPASCFLVTELLTGATRSLRWWRG